jgi:hypothetical protein
MLPVTLTLLIGPTVAVPAPEFLADALVSAEITQADDARSGFQLVFHIDRGGPAGVLDYPAFLSQLVRPFNRVIVTVMLNAIPRVLIDGVITTHQFAPSNEPGGTSLTLTGEDVSVMMDLEEKVEEHPAQSEMIIANKLILEYAQYGLVPMVIPPFSIDFPSPTERIPVQRGTDLAYLKAMADRFGYVFYVIPGPAPFMNMAYWGPPIRVGVLQSAISINFGPFSTADTLSFQYNALAPVSVSGQVQDSLTNETMPVKTFMTTRLPPLASMPALPFQLPNVKTVQLGDAPGQNIVTALARAQGKTDASMDSVVTGTGTLDAVRYGGILMPRALVGVRGAGYGYDGAYYVKRVTHSIHRGSYKQNFTITREGTGSLLPLVVP